MSTSLPVGFHEIVDAIAERASRQARPFVIAVDGRSGVGKSTFSRQLCQRLGATCVEGDDFFGGGVEVSDQTDEHLANSCIDWRRLRPVLEALRAGRPARYHPFDWDRFDGSLAARAALLAPARIVVLEGVYAARPQLADLVDCAVLLTLADELREARLLAREGELTAWDRQWHRGEDWYFAREAPPERFDFVVATDI
jgi:uridine kinase